MTNARPQPVVDSTREQLLDAAEELFLAEGPDNVSLRAIVRHAGQRNQSALQYHFGNRAGLLAAIRHRRMSQLETRRSELLEQNLDLGANPSVRDCCALLVRAPFLLCREQSDFRDMLGALGPRLLISDRQLIMLEAADTSASLRRIMEYMFRKMEHLPGELLMLRIGTAQGAVLLSITRRARNRESFRGALAELFYNNLVDQLAAMLDAPVSPETQKALSELS
ncbi:TetR/AcrR family transcriptional regulator [Congregibacter sp.]|uniref:TetR/AcrR family transcriptional regulator n=1 Tax=Congregibacter sp. TaxID=2744308 RepID=UPI003F6B251A